MNLEADILAIAKKAKQKDGRDFKSLCSEVFASAEGQALLAMLCTARNPVNRSFVADARLATHIDGNCEVVALLWRYGAQSNFVPEIPTETEPN